MDAHVLSVKELDYDIEVLKHWQDHNVFAHHLHNLANRLYSIYDLIWLRILKELSKQNVPILCVQRLHNAMFWLPDQVHDNGLPIAKAFVFKLMVLEVLLTKHDVCLNFYDDGSWTGIGWENEAGQKKSNQWTGAEVGTIMLKEIASTIVDFDFKEAENDNCNIQSKSEQLLQHDKEEELVFKDLLHNDKIKFYESHPLNPETLTKHEGFEDITEEEAQAIIIDLQKLNSIFYNICLQNVN